jgi:two-component system phosphate regulon sensor histidine kinase PhoR
MDNVAQVAITDQGIGIPRDALPRLFERFYRIEGGEHGAIKGAHGGQISVSSEAGKGSTFSFTLPCTNDA